MPIPRAVFRGACLVSALPPAAPPEPERASRPPLVPSLSLAIRLAIWLRKGVILVLGLSVVLVGVVMLVTPGPAFVVIPAGLAILATEFYWARRLLQEVRRRIAERMHQALGGPAPPVMSPSGEAANPSQSQSPGGTPQGAGPGSDAAS